METWGPAVASAKDTALGLFIDYGPYMLLAAGLWVAFRVTRRIIENLIGDGPGPI